MNKKISLCLFRCYLVVFLVGVNRGILIFNDKYGT